MTLLIVLQSMQILLKLAIDLENGLLCSAFGSLLIPLFYFLYLTNFSFGCEKFNETCFILLSLQRSYILCDSKTI